MPPDSDIIALALAEDIGSGDVTSKYFTNPKLALRGGLSHGSLASSPGWMWPRKYSAGWMQISEIVRRVKMARMSLSVKSRWWCVVEPPRYSRPSAPP